MGVTVIFERETEIGRCDYSSVEPACGQEVATEDTTILAHTLASLSGAQGMLKIEQQCYLRHGEDLPEQPWIKPEITLEPALDSRPQMAELAQTMHNHFVDSVRARFPEQLLR